MSTDCVECTKVECPFKAEPDPKTRVTIRAWNSYGELMVNIGGKNYSYFGVEKFHYRKIQIMLQKGLHGKVIQYLNCHHSKPEYLGLERSCTKKTT